MHRRQVLAGIGALSVPLVAGCVSAPTPSGTPLENPSFESGLDGWTVGTDLPTDPNTGDPVATEAAVTDEVASDGKQSLSLFIDGRQDDGAIWVQQPVDLSGVSTLSVAVYSESESFNTITKLAVYAGPDPGRPLAESDFDTSQATETHEGWKTWTYPVREAGEGLVAVGIAVVWETEVVRFIDEIRIE